MNEQTNLTMSVNDIKGNQQVTISQNVDNNIGNFGTGRESPTKNPDSNTAWPPSRSTTNVSDNLPEKSVLSQPGSRAGPTEFSVSNSSHPERLAMQPPDSNNFQKNHNSYSRFGEVIQPTSSSNVNILSSALPTPHQNLSTNAHPISRPITPSLYKPSMINLRPPARDFSTLSSPPENLSDSNISRNGTSQNIDQKPSLPGTSADRVSSAVISSLSCLQAAQSKNISSLDFLVEPSPVTFPETVLNQDKIREDKISSPNINLDQAITFSRPLEDLGSHVNRHQLQIALRKQKAIEVWKLAHQTVLPNCTKYLNLSSQTTQVSAYKQAASQSLLSTIPRPFDMSWPGAEREELQSLTLAAALQRRVRLELQSKFDIKTNFCKLSKYCPVSHTSKELVRKFCNLTQILQNLSSTYIEPSSVFSAEVLFTSLISSIQSWALPEVLFMMQHGGDEMTIPLNLYLGDKFSYLKRKQSLLALSSKKNRSAVYQSESEQIPNQGSKNMESINSYKAMESESNGNEVFSQDITDPILSFSQTTDIDNLLFNSENESLPSPFTIPGLSPFTSQTSLPNSYGMKPNLTIEDTQNYSRFVHETDQSSVAAIGKLTVGHIPPKPKLNLESARAYPGISRDIEEQLQGLLWDDAVNELICPTDSQTQLTGEDNNLLWGEGESTVSGRIACTRYTLPAGGIFSIPDPGDLSESFSSIDRSTYREVRLQSNLKRSLAAYKITNPIEQVLAFSGLLIDANDEDLFFSHPTAEDFKCSSSTIPCYSVHEELNPTATRQLRRRIDENNDGFLTSSSGSLSDVIDDWAVTAGHTGSTVAMANSVRDLTNETKLPDKKLQLKKRRQEKEKRIRLALLGLAPQTARNVEDLRKHHQPTEIVPTPQPNMSHDNFTGGNSVKEYRAIRRRYRSMALINRLKISFEEETKQRDPYAVQVRPGQQHRDQLELRHSALAFMFIGVPTRPFPVYVNRFHRPDFRWGLYEAHMASEASNNMATPGFKSATTNTSGGRLILHVGNRRISDNPSDSQPKLDKLWTPWIVKPPHISSIIRRARYNEDPETIDGFHKTTSESGVADLHSISNIGSSIGTSPSKHPADLICRPEDLTLTDVAPIALFEYCEQLPPLLNNIGMVARISKYYRPPSENMTLSQAKKKIRGRLGRFGRLKLADSFIPFFGSQMKLARNQGVVVVQSRLFKAPIFPHPTNPHSSLKTTSRRAADWRYGLGRFHDFRATDFLLIRNKIPQRNAAGQDSYTYDVCLRPVYLEPSTERTFREERDDYDDSNRADCTVYTVGQTQPFCEVPPPTSKRCLEIRRDWLRAYALRFAKQGITNFHSVKARCQSKFQNLFEPGVLQKHLMTCRDSLPTSSSTTPPLFPGQGLSGMTIRVVDEEYLRSVFSPETLCALESALVANSHLIQTGLTLLRSAERVSVAVRELEVEETLARDQLSKARRQLKAYDTRYNQLLRFLPSDHPLRRVNYEEQTVVSGCQGGNVSIFDLVCPKRLSPVARLIEEMLLLTPWNITRDCVDIITRQGGQFSLDGIGDPSGGRGEGISLIRLQRRDLGRGPTSQIRGSGNTPAPDTPKEDLRKLSMKELHDRLIKFGFDTQTVKTLPRWDQVALVRRFQCEDTGLLRDDGNVAKSGRMPTDVYVKRLNEIFLNQRRALEADEPQLTASDSDSATNGATDPGSDTSSQGPPSTSKKTIGKDSQELSLEQNSTTRVSQNEPVLVKNLEDELLSGLEVGSDDEERRNEGKNRASKNNESLERKALEEFRQSLGKSRGHDGKVLERMAELFTQEELRLLQTKPIPRLRWARKTRDPRTGESKSEKVVYIYGEENIRYFYEWRKKRIARKRYLLASGAGLGQNQVGTASRTCRRCGQVGHISSNPICPQYCGPRKARPIAPIPAAGSSGTVRQFVPSPGFTSSDEEGSRNSVSITDPIDISASTIDVASSSTTGKGKRVLSICGVNSRLSDIEKSTKAQKQNKSKDAATAAGVRPRPEEHPLPGATKLPTRTTARQRQILESKGSLAGGAVQSYQGSFESAVNEINQIFQRVISKTDRDKRKWAVFREEVSEADAPGYFSLVKNPIWLNKMVDKCKAREYRSTSAFLYDIQLLVDNCFRYNPMGHWIRPLVQSLGDFLREETLLQGPWLTELDRFIQEHLQEQDLTIVNREGETV